MPRFAELSALLATLAGTALGPVSLATEQISRVPPPLVGTDVSDAVPEWLPGIWQASAYLREGTEVRFLREHQYRYALENEDGLIRAERWGELLVPVEVVFNDNRTMVIRETWEGSTREFTIVLERVTDIVGRQPTMRGVARIEQSTDGPAYFPVVFRKLPNDFFEGPL